MSSIGLSCFSLFWHLVCWKKSSDVFDAQINAWLIEINIVSQLILNHIRIHLTQLKQKLVQSKYVFWSFHKQICLHFFCFKGVLFYISYSLCQIVNLFLCKYIVKMHLWRTHFLNQPLSVCHSHIHCSLVMSLHLSLFLLCLSNDISSHSDLLGMQVWPKHCGWVAFQLKGFICGQPVDLPGHCCFRQHRRVSFLCRWQK